MQGISVIEADLARPEHQRDLLAMMDAYVADPMEEGAPLPQQIRDALIPELRKHPACHVFLAYEDGKAIGFSLCFLGFSSFEARPLLNIHDIGVLPGIRGRGVGLQMLQAIEAKARALRCCRLTLEVRLDNDRARGLYRKFGFAQRTVGSNHVPMEFWWKPLQPGALPKVMD
jgi:ribosomal protein S18 acetylase RimI-like enzyme